MMRIPHELKAASFILKTLTHVKVAGTALAYEIMIFISTFGEGEVDFDWHKFS